MPNSPSVILKVWKFSGKQLPFIYDGRPKKLRWGDDSRNNTGIYTSPQNPKANSQAEVLLTSPCAAHSREESSPLCFLPAQRHVCLLVLDPMKLAIKRPIPGSIALKGWTLLRSHSARDCHLLNHCAHHMHPRYLQHCSEEHEQDSCTQVELQPQASRVYGKTSFPSGGVPQWLITIEDRCQLPVSLLQHFCLAKGKLRDLFNVLKE